MTFLSSAFFFDPDANSEGSTIGTLLWSIVITALMAQVLLLPVKHLLPYVLQWSIHLCCFQTHIAFRFVVVLLLLL